MPALAHYQRMHPDTIVLAAIADLDLASAQKAAADFGFAAAYRDGNDMVAREKPDACLALTPVELNATAAIELARSGVPVLMEKPPGAQISEGRSLVTELAKLNTPVMVSMNRRFDPLLRAALNWIGARPIREVKAAMTRVGRTEPQFVEHTGLHVVDVVLSIGGEVTACETRRLGAGGARFQASLTFANAATALIDLQPRADAIGELLCLIGDDFRVEVRSAEFDRGSWQAWVDGRPLPEVNLPHATPGFVANGTLAETEAFMDALRGRGGFHPTPADVLPAMEICHLLTCASENSPLPS